MFHELENVLRKKKVFTIFVFLYFLLRQKVLNQTRLATKLFQPAIETKRGKNIPRIFKTLFLSDKRKVIIACKTFSQHKNFWAILGAHINKIKLEPYEGQCAADKNAFTKTSTHRYLYQTHVLQV